MITILQEDLKITSSKMLPEVHFSQEGYMKIDGKIIPDFVAGFFEPLLDWINEIRFQNLVFDLKIEYLNTNALVHLYRLLQALESNQYLKEIVINWYYEEEDEEYFEKGQYIAEKLSRIKFNFCSFQEPE